MTDKIRGGKPHLDDNAQQLDDGIRRLMRWDTEASVNELHRKRRIVEAIATVRNNHMSTHEQRKGRFGSARSSFEQADAGRRRLQMMVLAAVLLLGVGLGVVFSRMARIQSNDASFSASKDVTAKRIVTGITSTHETQQVVSTKQTNGIPQEGAFSAASHVTLTKGVDALLESDTKMVVQQSSDRLLRLSLTAGRILVSVNPKGPHPRVEVVTEEGVVVVKGTVFSVSTSPEISVSVLRGKVEVVDARGKTLVTAQHRLSMETGVRREMSPTEMIELADVAANIGVSIKNLPHVQLLSLKADSIQNAPGNASASNRVDSGGKIRPGELKKLLSDARARKRNGDWKGALEKYEAVIALSPDSTAAAGARIAAGNIRLRLKDAQEALDHFSAYLSGGATPLGQEAMFGQIEALRQLGDLERELAVSRKFLNRWPNAVHAESIRDKVFHLEILTGIPAKPSAR